MYVFKKNGDVMKLEKKHKLVKLKAAKTRKTHTKRVGLDGIDL
jgi:hypothetical protein